MSRRKITNQEWARVVDRVANGESYQAAREWAAHEFGAPITLRSVISACTARRDDIGRENKGRVREALGRTIPSDLDTLEWSARRIRAIAKDAAREGLRETELRAHEQLRKTIDTRLHYAGVDQPDAKAEAEASPRRAAELVRESFGVVGPKPEDLSDAGPN